MREARLPPSAGVAVNALLGRMEGTQGLVAQMLYSTGMRLMECVRLRVEDVEVERAEIVERDGKGAQDRVTTLPQSVIAPLREHLAHRCAVNGVICSRLPKPATPHTLRHSLATHLLQGATTSAPCRNSSVTRMWPPR